MSTRFVNCLNSGLIALPNYHVVGSIAISAVILFPPCIAIVIAIFCQYC